MAKRKQHYVPKVYIKAWKTEVESLSEPSKKFQGVYVIEGGSDIGSGFNCGSILWEPHLYTVGFEHVFAMKSCSQIYNYFVDKIYELMKTNMPDPIYGKLGYSIIKTKESIRRYLDKIDDWEFYYYNDNLAKKKSIINRINDLNCYILEDAFSDNYEDRWEYICKGFIDEVHNGVPIIGGNGKRISTRAAVNMLEHFFVMLCRSPRFDAMGTYTWMKEEILYSVFADREAVDDLMTDIWYIELYRIFFKKTGGFYHNVIQKTLNNCHMILFEAYDNAGTFITTDNPAFQHKSSVLKENINGFIFPLTPKYLLFVAKGERDSIEVVGHRFASKDTVRFFNKIIKNNKQNKIISSERFISNLI